MAAGRQDAPQHRWLRLAHELGTVEGDLLDAVRGVHQLDVVRVAAVDFLEAGILLERREAEQRNVFGQPDTGGVCARYVSHGRII